MEGPRLHYAGLAKRRGVSLTYQHVGTAQYDTSDSTVLKPESTSVTIQGWPVIRNTDSASDREQASTLQHFTVPSSEFTENDIVPTIGDQIVFNGTSYTIDQVRVDSYWLGLPFGHLLITRA